MSKPGAECVITVPSMWDRREFVDISSYLTFGDIEGNARPRTKVLDYIQNIENVFNGVGDEGAVISVPLASLFEGTRGDVVSLSRGGELVNKRFDHKVEK